MRALIALTTAVVVVLVAGCGELIAIEGASVMISDKTVEDHIISYTSGKNCSTIREQRGLTYCEEDQPNHTANVHCYRTLGNVTCYDRPDPYPGGAQKVGENEHNYLKR